MALREKLLAEIEDLSYCSRNQLRNFGTEWGYDIANTDRQLRKLTQEGLVKPVYRDKFIIGYVPCPQETSEEIDLTQQIRPPDEPVNPQQRLL